MKYIVERGFGIKRGEQEGQCYNVFIEGQRKHYTVERYNDGSFKYMNCWYKCGEGRWEESRMRTTKEGSYMWKQVVKAVEATI